MKGRVIHGLTIAAFAVALGHMAWQSCLGPPLGSCHTVGGEVPVLVAPDPEARQLYLRQEIYLSQQPSHAWIEVLATDRLEVYVNGRLMQRSSLDGFPVAVLANLTANLHTGRNVIALHVKQTSARQPPMVAVRGSYRLSDGDHSLCADDRWRCGAAFERNASWWFAQEFDERHWPFARWQTATLRAKVNLPPRAVSDAELGHWISPVVADKGSASFRHEIEVEGRAQTAWLRVTASSAYRLSVNGIRLDQQEDQLGVPVLARPVCRLYDIAPVIRSGKNVFALAVTDEARVPHVKVDAEVVDAAGRSVRFGSDGEWLYRSGIDRYWMADEPDDARAWQPCHVETGYLDMPAWSVRRQVVEMRLPWQVQLRRLAGEVSVIVAVALLAFLLCRWVGRWLSAGSAPLASMALILPTLACAVAVLATFDPRIAPHDVFQVRWLALAVAAVGAQWLLMAGATWAASWGRNSSLPENTADRSVRPTKLGHGQSAARPWTGLATVALLTLLVAAGFWVRARDLYLEPLQWDEVENYYVTQGLLKRGFPNMEVHPDLPVLWTHTSELEFVWHALVALGWEDAASVMRLPGLLFSTLNILLVFFVGRRLCGTPVGLVAAALLAFAPICVLMSTIGRYFSQLQFFATLTVYCLWLTVEGAGPINRRMLWCTVASFLAMFLTWEASALIAPGLILATLMQRRGRIRTVFAEPALWIGAVLVGLVVVVQRSHGGLAQSQFLWYGVSLSDIRLLPMWGSQAFQPWYYLWESSWNQDSLLPLLGLLGAIVLAVRGPFRQPVRFLLLIHLTTCMLMGILLPTSQFRYVHHLLPLLMLLASASAVALVRSLIAAACQLERPWPYQVYGRMVGALTLVVLVAVGSGLTLEMRGMERLRIEGIPPHLFKFPDMGTPARYVRDHMQEGDVVLANHIYQINHLMGLREKPDPATRYTVATGACFLPVTLTDRDDRLVDRRDGARVLTSQAQLEDLFARHDRIWYIVQPGQHTAVNLPIASAFLRQQMEVVYEDWDMMVLFWGGNHRSAKQRHADDEMLNAAQANYLR